MMKETIPQNSIVIIDMSVPNQRRLCTYESKLPNSCFERDPLNVQIFLKMHRSDYAKRWLKEMQKIDEDHTLTQLETAWQNLSVVVLSYWRHISSSKISLRSLRLQA